MRASLLSITLVALLGALGCQATPALGWPAEVRAAHSRGPRIRPPEGWSRPEVAEAFHGRGWGELSESWIAEGRHGPVGHCWRGTVRGLAGRGDVVPSDLHEHGLEDVALGSPTEVGRLTVSADDRSLTACLPEPRVAHATAALSGECEAFGPAIEMLTEALAASPEATALSMDAREVRLVVRWGSGTLDGDRTLRRLHSMGYEASVHGEVADLPRMSRTDDDWRVEIELPPTGVGPVVLRASTAMPRRTICGPEPLPPPIRRI